MLKNVFKKEITKETTREREREREREGGSAADKLFCTEFELMWYRVSVRLYQDKYEGV